MKSIWPAESIRRGDDVMKVSVTNSVAGVLLLALSAMAAAQAPPKDPASPPASAQVLSLTPAQRLAIYQSITGTQKNSAAPNGFHVTVGARVPDSVELTPLSDTLAKLAPQAKDFSVAMIEKQVILVDPSNRQVVAVVTQEPANEVR
jgi:hypothetical protein